jgi:hypothetical protein
MQASSETVAREDVAERQREEGERGGDQHDVQHGDAPSDEKFNARTVASSCAQATRDYLSSTA